MTRLLFGKDSSFDGLSLDAHLISEYTAHGRISYEIKHKKTAVAIYTYNVLDVCMYSGAIHT